MTSAGTLNVTALAPVNGVSVFQCWALVPGFVTSAQPGTVGAKSLQLGNLANASYSIIPADFKAGLHNAPNVQYVVFLSGLALIQLPNTTDSVYVKGGANGLIIAADVAGTSKYGHNTTYPSSEETRALQIPTYNGVVPGHTVLYNGPCTGAEVGEPTPPSKPPKPTKPAKPPHGWGRRASLEDLD